MLTILSWILFSIANILTKTRYCVWPFQSQHCAHQRMQSWSCGQGLFGIGRCFAFHLEYQPPGKFHKITFTFSHLTLWHPPPPWRVFGQVEVVGGRLLLLPGRHVVKQELLLHRLLAAEIGDQLSWQKLPLGKKPLPSSCPPRSGHIHLHPEKEKLSQKMKITDQKRGKASTCFLSCGSMEPSLPHSSSPPLVETSFKPSLQIFPPHIMCVAKCRKEGGQSGCTFANLHLSATNSTTFGRIIFSPFHSPLRPVAMSG